MGSFIKTLKDKIGNIIIPRTNFDAVSDANGISLTERIADITLQNTVVAVANIYTLDLALRKNFSIECTDVNAKSIVFSNIPADLDFSQPIVVKAKMTAVAPFTYPAGNIWQDASDPVFTTGKTYYFTFMRAGTGWHTSCIGEW